MCVCVSVYGCVRLFDVCVSSIYSDAKWHDKSGHPIASKYQAN